jgi:hypothetical protein
MKTVLGPSWPNRSDIRLVSIKSDSPGTTDSVYIYTVILSQRENDGGTNMKDIELQIACFVFTCTSTSNC